jgi:DNA-binding transcriptional LysR family regulator
VDTDRGLAFDTAISSVEFAMAGEGVALADIDMFAADIAAGRLVAPYDAVVEDGYGYYVKFHPEDLGDPVIAQFRSWLIGRFKARETGADRSLHGAETLSKP